MRLLLFLALLRIARGQGTCPPDYGEHPVVLVSLDGFRAEYLQRGLTPNIQRLREEGISVPFMRATYPTLTYPNHYTTVTGLYPESHGIIANSFGDPVFREKFKLGSEGSRDGKWWWGEPIWNTVVKQGKKSATFFWPGSDADIEGMRPTYYYTYDGEVEYETRVEQILLWLSLPEDSRPVWMCMYVDEPDHTGHEFGPRSQQVNAKLTYVDGLIGALVRGIEALGLTDCVNLILTSDHGMDSNSDRTVIELADFVPDLYDLGYTYVGTFPRINVYGGQEEEDAVRRNLTCQKEQLRQYVPEELPRRFHFVNNRRIEDVVINLKTGYQGNVKGDWHLLGNHGYDNYYEEMKAIFVARGPEFRSGFQAEPFQNIEVYNLMCHLAGVKPAPNNGTLASLHHLLRGPPPYPKLKRELRPRAPSFPSKREMRRRKQLSGCIADDSSPVNVDFSPLEEQKIVWKNVPWGTPLSGDLPADFILLSQLDHVTGYSQQLKLPLWTSFIAEGNLNSQKLPKWCSDVRLTNKNTQTCKGYRKLVKKNITMHPLFPDRYEEDPSQSTTFLVSNAVPMTTQLLPKWRHLTESLIHKWVSNHGAPINVIAGPIFDHDADSIVDDYRTIDSFPALPSHLFLIATRCKSSEISLSDCPPSNLDSLAFIFPEVINIPNCLSMDEFALEFSAKVKDIEIATGLTFFPDLPYEERTKLVIRIHSTLWP